jgi:hypothetical protein
MQEQGKGTKDTDRSLKNHLLTWLTAIAPALLVLFVTVVFSAFFGGPHLWKGWQVIWKTLFRFFRFTLVLCLPLFATISIYGFIVEKKKKVLLQIDGKREFTIHRVKHWVFRPFQGIGIGLVFAMKLLTILQLIVGPTSKTFLLIPQGQFELARLLMVTAVTVFVSLLLSVLWTLDDMGIRYFNRKDQELKMIGKYVGTLMPLIFGLYGMFGLLATYPASQAFAYAFKIVVVLYPPLAFFAAVHTHFLRKRLGLLLKRTSLRKAVILEHE